MVSSLVPIFFGLLFFGLPIFASLALAVTLTLHFMGTIDPLVVPMRMFSGMNNFSLMSIPFYLMAAELRRVGGLSDGLLDQTEGVTGWGPGGMAAGAVLACMFMGAIPGSSPATVVATDTSMYPAKVAAGENKYVATGRIATA